MCGLVAKRKEKRKDYLKKYYTRNKEKIRKYQKEYMKKYYIENKEKIRERTKEYYVENKEKLVDRSKEYHVRNREKILEKRKDYYSRNKERLREKAKKWKLDNPKKIKEQKMRRRVNGRMKPGTLKKVLDENVFNYGAITCEKCFKLCFNSSEYHIDHIIPVSKGGTNDFNNLQVLCVTCNQEKWINIYDYRSINRNNS